MKAFITCMVFVAVLAQAAAAFPPEMKCENDTLTITIKDITRITASDLRGYLTIDLEGFKKLHMPKTAISIVKEETTELTVYLAFATSVEAIVGKAAKYGIIKFNSSVNRAEAKKMLEQ
jgi:hypothetical protein